MDAVLALIESVPALFGPGDLAALACLAVAWTGLTLAIERSHARHPSMSRLMDGYRRAWFEQIAGREVRIMDTQLLTLLRAGAAFFASTCLIAIGGVAALIGEADLLVGLVADLGAEDAGRVPVWEAKLLVILLIMVNAFLKFVWSHRLFGYTAVLMGAIPPAGDGGCAAAVARANAVDRAAARSFNRGLRAIYFAIATLAWFLGPVPFAVAVFLTTAMLVRREFFSASRRALLPAATD
ncbi:MAG: DUF599 domain-containing protein [Paracoccaceae bacterium]